MNGSLRMVGVQNKDQCSKKAVYECPICGCQSYICKAHGGQLKDSDHIRFLVATKPFLCRYVCLYVEEEAEEEEDNEHGEEAIVSDSHQNMTMIMMKDEDDNEEVEESIRARTG